MPQCSRHRPSFAAGDGCTVRNSGISNAASVPAARPQTDLMVDLAHRLKLSGLQTKAVVQEQSISISDSLLGVAQHQSLDRHGAANDFTYIGIDLVPLKWNNSTATQNCFRPHVFAQCVIRHSMPRC